MTTTDIDAYIRHLVMLDMEDRDMSDYNSDIDDSLYELFNNYNDNFDDFPTPELDDFMEIQYNAMEYLEGCDSLNLVSQEKKDWKWWCCIYALSRNWIDSGNYFEECFENNFGDAIINFQSNVRRRQATIRTIRKLHLTGNL